jgi:hypothetical protein
MDIKPLMTQENYSKFLELRESYAARNQPNSVPAYPFVPVFGSGGDLPYRFLIIGQATRGWDKEAEHGTFDRSREVAAGVLPDFFLNDGGPFWTFVRKFLCRTMTLLKHEFDIGELYKCVAWSNLAKIGETGKNPSDKFLGEQAALCVEQLNYELAEYKPDVVLVAAGTFGHREVLYPAFGTDWPHLEKTNRHVQFRLLRNSCDNGIPAIWTNHPRNLGAKHDNILEVITKIASVFL